MLVDPRSDEQFAAQFFVNDLLRVGAEDEMDFVRGRVEEIEQSLQINRTTRAGRGEDEFHYK